MWKISSNPFIKNHRPLVMAHRGDSANVPENTIPAFEDAYRLGVDCIETDVHLTKDNQFVFFHDNRLERTTNGEGEIKNFTVTKLKQLDAGYCFYDEKSKTYPFRGSNYKIHTIEEILPIFPNVRFNMDIKSKNPLAPKLLAEKLAELNVEERVMVGSFHQQQIKKFRTFSKAPTSGGSHEILRFLLKSKKWIRNSEKKKLLEIEIKPELFEENQKQWFGRILPYVAFQIPEQFHFLKIVTPEFIQFAHYMGIAVQIWTVNEVSDMQRLLEWNIDGIFTDHPKKLLEIFNY